MVVLKLGSHAAFILTNIKWPLVSKSLGAGSQVDLVTPPPKLSRCGSVDGSRGKGTRKQPSDYFPDNQLGLEDSPQGMSIPSPKTQSVPRKPDKPVPAKHTAAKSQPKPKARAPASVHTRVRGKTNVEHGPTGESKKTKPVRNEGTADKDVPETRQAKKTPQKGSTVKKRKTSKGDKGAAVKAKTRKGNTGVKQNKGDKGPAAKDKASKGDQTNKVVEYDGTQNVKNPGGRSSASGINRKKRDAEETPDKQREEPAAKKQKISDNKSNTAPTERKENDDTAAVAALQRADTLEQEEKAAAEQEKLAKRKAYKARKQRFYNSLSSGGLVD